MRYVKTLTLIGLSGERKEIKEKINKGKTALRYLITKGLMQF
jgi:hypothetical protein